MFETVGLSLSYRCKGSDSSEAEKSEISRQSREFSIRGKIIFL